ncbi:LapA family protein [Citricoccus nitrophenolicus]|uniref:LapA family protein n=1 Tax=Citricoccus nitrophenolicus TaxID=863575 RepID=UPI0031EBD596
MDRRPEPSRGEQIPEAPSGTHPADGLGDPTAVRSPEETSGAVEPVSPREREVAPPSAIDPSLDNPTRTGLSGGTWIALILGAVVLVMLLIFILQNNVEADFAYFGWSFTLPLGIAMLFAAIAGVLVMGLFGSVRLLKLGRRVRRLEKEREAIKAQLR